MNDVMDTIRLMAPAAANIIVVLIGIAFAAVAVGCLTYALRSGQFREIEEAKYRMLDSEEPWPPTAGTNTIAQSHSEDAVRLTFSHGGRS